MPRFLYKSWQDKRPAPNYRIRWYDPGNDWNSIKLTVDTPEGQFRSYYPTIEAAQQAWDDFVRKHGPNKESA